LNDEDNAMHATIQCICGKHLDADAQRPGDRAQCSACAKVFVIGEPVKTTAIRTNAPPAKTTPATSIVAAQPQPQSIEKPTERSSLATFLFVAIILCTATLILIAASFLIRPMGGGHGLMDVAVTQARGPLTSACQAYERKHGHWPKFLEVLLEQDEKGGPYLENLDCLRDPWGNRYKYDANGPMNKGSKPDIWAENPRNGVKVGNWPMIRQEDE